MKPEDIAPINSSAGPWHIGFHNEIADMLRPSGDWHPGIVRYKVVQVCDYDGKHVCWARSPEHAALIVEAVNKTAAQPRIKVGKYTICRQDANSVWIQTDGGEGGQFSEASFEAAVDAYYRANF